MNLDSDAKAFDTGSMVLIPAGPCRLGTAPDQIKRLARAEGRDASWLAGEAPERTPHLGAFWIDRYPVTNAQYHAFSAATGYPPPEHWGGPEPRPNQLELPVTYVHREDARAYAAWAGKRLPTEVQWEKAARGPEGLTYPWGEVFDPGACCWGRTGAQGPVAATTHPTGASPYGVMDMTGNVAEWCENGPDEPCAWIKGGCYLMTRPVDLRPASRGLSGYANNRVDYIGFRCVREVAP